MTKKFFSALAALALLAACDPEMNEVPATSITFDEPAVTMKVGETKTLTVTVEPENTTDKVEWECLICRKCRICQICRICRAMERMEVIDLRSLQADLVTDSNG